MIFFGWRFGLFSLWRISWSHPLLSLLHINIYALFFSQGLIQNPHFARYCSGEMLRSYLKATFFDFSLSSWGTQAPNFSINPIKWSWLRNVLWTGVNYFRQSRLVYQPFSFKVIWDVLHRNRCGTCHRRQSRYFSALQPFPCYRLANDTLYLHVAMSRAASAAFWPRWRSRRAVSKILILSLQFIVWPPCTAIIFSQHCSGRRLNFLRGGIDIEPYGFAAQIICYNIQ